jgi:uncharacterized membrane protein YdjX (TVP38/TMEM64 family)
VVSVLVWVLFVVCVTVFLRNPAYGDFVERLVGSVPAKFGTLPGILLFVVVLAVVLMTPLSSASVLVLIAVPVFGPVRTFVGSLAAGGLSAILSYELGAWLGRRRLKLTERVQRTTENVARSAVKTFVLSATVRAIPNPLYDVWGYAFGLASASRASYLLGSAVGGALPLGLICFLPPSFLGSG